MNATTTDTAAARRLPPRETQRILAECRDLAVARLIAAFTQILVKVGDVLMEINMMSVTGTSGAYLASLMNDYALGQDMPVGLRRPPSDTIEQKLVRVEDLLPSFPPP